MSNIDGRLRQLELSLPPKRAALRAIKQILAYGSAEAYKKMLAAKPVGEGPWSNAVDDVWRGIIGEMSRTGEGPPDSACQQARREIYSLWYLFEEVTSLVSSMEILVELGIQGLSQDWLSNYRSRLLALATRDFICATPYPLDARTAAVVEDAVARSVVPMPRIEINMAGWVRNYFADRGERAIPNYYRNYLRAQSAENCRGERRLALDPSAIKELRSLFGNDAALNDFLAGRDFRLGFARIRDAEVCTIFDEVQAALLKLIAAGVFERGRCVHLPTVPMFFLRYAPLIEGRWVDQVIIELAECGAQLISKGLTQEESADMHPLRMARICSLKNDPSAPRTPQRDEVAPIFAQARRNLSKFPGERKVIADRPYIDLEEYLSWNGRKIKGRLQAEVTTEEGLLASSWESWVETHGSLGKAKLAGVKVGRVGFLVRRPRYAILGSIGEATAEQQLRDQAASMLTRTIDSVSGGEGRIPPRLARSRGENSEDFRSVWRTALLICVGEQLLVKGAIAMIEHKYFDGHSIVFPDSVKELKRQLDFCYSMASWFNFDFSELRSWEGIGMGKDTAVRDKLDKVFEYDGPINLEELEQAVNPLIPKKVEEIVDRAMVGFHNSWGDRKDAKALVAKHRADVSPFAKYRKGSESALPPPKDPGSRRAAPRSASPGVVPNDEA